MIRGKDQQIIKGPSISHYLTACNSNPPETVARHVYFIICYIKLSTVNLLVIIRKINYALKKPPAK
jgi:hypothetical protein